MSCFVIGMVGVIVGFAVTLSVTVLVLVVVRRMRDRALLKAALDLPWGTKP